MKYIRTCLAAVLITAIAVSIVGCTTIAGAVDLMDGITPQSVTGRQIDETFTESMADFSIRLFQESITDSENSLISPLSVMLALAMTTNGADAETLAELEELLGSGIIPINTLNEYLYSYIGGLPSRENSKLSIANSIWIRNAEALQVEPEFLQTNADFYHAQIYAADFDDSTIREINDWVDKNTDGMIDSVINEIDDEIMFLINAVAFDAEWENIYHEHAIREGEFTDNSGNKHLVDFMYSVEGRFISDGLATGFIKHYAGGSYSFVALLPNEGISIDDYIETLTGTGFLDMLENRQFAEVHASMPKFEYEYEISMLDALKALGIHEAFEIYGADFSRMATYSNENIFISEVFHKTFISVDERGTRAGAVTVVAPTTSGAPAEKPKIVRLDRPFIFAIVDSSTDLPIFIGTVLTP